METRYCHACGKPLAADAAFCPACGTARQAAPQEPPSEPPVPAAAPPAPPAIDWAKAVDAGARGDDARRASFPRPPSLHWGLVFLFGVLTLGLFSVVWYFVQTTWVKKIDPRSRATLYMGLSVACYALYVAMYLVASVGMALSGHGSTGAVGIGLVLMIGSLLPMLAYVVLYYCAYYSMSGSLQRVLPAEYGVRPEIGGVTLFFFSVFYLQGQLSWLARWKDSGRTAPPPPKGIFWALWGTVIALALAAAVGIGMWAAQRDNGIAPAEPASTTLDDAATAGDMADAQAQEDGTYLQPTVEQDDADPAGADVPDDAPDDEDAADVVDDGERRL